VGCGVGCVMGCLVGCLVGCVVVCVGWCGGVCGLVWCGVWGVWGGVCGGVWDGVVCVCVWGRGGRFSLALEHSKVCTLCDFGHLQFIDMCFITRYGQDQVSFETDLQICRI
jgi:hypothetical protein